MLFSWVTNIGTHLTHVRRYRKTRLPAGTYLPAALFLCTASLVTGWPATITSWAIMVFLAGTLLIQFRLWDDLSDVAGDRLEHPERVLCQATTLRPFWLILAVSFAINVSLIAISSTQTAVAVFLVLNLAMSAWYWADTQFRINAVIRYHVVLLKYPVFVYLLSPGPNDPAGVPIVYAMGLAYFCFCIYELLHDPRLHQTRGKSYLLAIEWGVLELLAIMLLVDLYRVAESWAVVQAALTILGALIFLFLLQRQRLQTAPGGWCYAVFVIGFCWLLNYAIATKPPFTINDHSRLGIAGDIANVTTTSQRMVARRDRQLAFQNSPFDLTSFESVLSSGSGS